MSKAVHPAVPGVVRDLRAAEASTDAHLAASGTLLVSLASGGEEAGLPFGALQGAIADASEAISLAVRGRHHLARAHTRLLATAVEHQLLPETGHGDVVPWCEPDVIGGSAQAPAEVARLRAVG